MTTTCKNEKQRNTSHWFLLCYLYVSLPSEYHCLIPFGSKSPEAYVGQDEDQWDAIAGHDEECITAHRLCPMFNEGNYVLFSLGELQDFHISQIIKPKLLSVAKRLAHLFYCAHPNELTKAPIVLEQNTIREFESCAYRLMFLRASDLAAGLEQGDNFTAPWTWARREISENEEEQRRTVLAQRALFRPILKKIVAKVEAMGPRYSEGANLLKRLPKPSDIMDDSSLFQTNSHYNNYALAMSDADIIKNDWPILYAFANEAIDIANRCRLYAVPIDEQFPGICWEYAYMNYFERHHDEIVEMSQGKVVWRGTTQDPSLSFFDWHANYQLIVDRIDNGFVSYEHMIQSRLPTQMAADETIQKIISTKDIDALMMIEAILSEDYKDFPPTRKDLESEGLGKSAVDTVVKKYPELFGNHKSSRDDKSMPGRGYFLRSPYDTIIPGNLEELCKLVRDQVDVSMLFQDEEFQKEIQSYVKLSLGFKGM